MGGNLLCFALLLEGLNLRSNHLEDKGSLAILNVNLVLRKNPGMVGDAGGTHSSTTIKSSSKLTS